VKGGLFSLSYWGPISYYAALIKYPRICLEQYDHFQKQSYRNRCYIDGPNGELMLNIAIEKGHKQLTRDAKFSASQEWSQKHWQALITSYGSSPFFDALAPEIERLFQQEFPSLALLNFQSTLLILKWLRYEGIVELSKEYQHEPIDWEDLRESFSPKRRQDNSFLPYPQVFDHKSGFKPELSILDLIFNEGPLAYDYLEQL